MKNLFFVGIFFINSILFAETSSASPIPTGPYPVGTATFELIDSQRKEIDHPEGRPIPLLLYFPMQQNANTTSENPSDVSLLTDEKHPLVFINHGNTFTSSDYSFIGEDLASHGYVVISLQHQLNSDPKEESICNKRSISSYARVIENLEFAFEWVQQHQETLFADKVNLHQVGLIGHSMSADALLALSIKISSPFNKKNHSTFFPHTESPDAKECLILLDPLGFSFPPHAEQPCFFLFAEERESYQRKVGTYRELLKAGHKVHYYKGATHNSFMDPMKRDEPSFNGSDEERKIFYDLVRDDLREFLKNSGIILSIDGSSN